MKFKEEWDELCAIYCDDEDRFEQIGTGVFLNLCNNIYLFTASHVIDELYKSKTAKLLIPTKDGFDSITGTLYHRHLSKNENRKDDKIDVSFYRLGQEIVDGIHKNFKPLTENNIEISDSFVSDIDQTYELIHPKKALKKMKNLYQDIEQNAKETIKFINDFKVKTTITFAGYPNGKSKVKDSIYSSEIVYYHGKRVEKERYKSLNYELQTNILAEFGKKGVNDANFNLQNFPKPNGISGGGIYRLVQTDDGLDRKLIGIGHTYKSKQHLFIGTNIKFCIDVLKNIIENERKGKLK